MQPIRRKVATNAVASLANCIVFAVTGPHKILFIFSSSSTKLCSEKKSSSSSTKHMNRPPTSSIQYTKKHVGVQEDSWMTDCRVKASVCLVLPARLFFFPAEKSSHSHYFHNGNTEFGRERTATKEFKDRALNWAPRMPETLAQSQDICSQTLRKSSDKM